jgi:peptidoglycan hydrolase CwlO-like protein
MTLADIVQKMKARVEAIDNIIATFQVTMDNANSTMDEMKVTLAKANAAIDEANATITQVRKDYEAFKKKVEDFISKHDGSKKHWPF